MGCEKALLPYDGKSFLSAIAGQLSRVSDDLVVVVGAKDPAEFGHLLGEGIGVFRDDDFLSNPLGGVITGLKHVTHQYAAIVGCDTPLLKAEVIEYLFEAKGDHVAAVPVWEEDEMGTMEPLCGVYEVAEAKKAAERALSGRGSLKQMVALMGDVQYVDVSQLRMIDESLESLIDVNTRQDYEALGARSRASSSPGRKGGR